MTERLYEKDSYCKEFKAVVVSCQQEGEFYNLVLDKTAFFPEGGGQTWDSGTIGGTPVLEVQIDNGVIIHKVSKEFKVGTDLEGVIDWDLRFARMQSHSGEHILSGLVHSLFGYDNKGFHMGETVMTVDFSGPMTKEDIEQVEWEANKAIYKNTEIYATYPSKEELGDIDYRSKIDPRDDMRLITIEGVDCCACCAPHVSKTGEIGLIKILDFIPHRGGTRVEIIAGFNAFKDYQKIHNSNKQLMGALSATRNGVVDAVSRQSEIVAIQKVEIQKLSQETALLKFKPEIIGNVAFDFSEGLSYDDLKCCVNSMKDSEAEICALFSCTQEGGCIYVISGEESKVNNAVKAVNAEFGGKGGGRNGYAQGKIQAAAKEDLLKFISQGF